MATTYEERLESMKAQRAAKGGVQGLYHANINVLNRDTLEDAMEHPESTHSSPFAFRVTQ